MTSFVLGFITGILLGMLIVAFIHTILRVLFTPFYILRGIYHGITRAFCMPLKPGHKTWERFVFLPLSCYAEVVANISSLWIEFYGQINYYSIKEMREMREQAKKDPNYFVDRP